MYIDDHKYSKLAKTLINIQTIITEIQMWKSAEFKESFPVKRLRSCGTSSFIDLNRTIWISENLPARPELSQHCTANYEKIYCAIFVPLGIVQLLKILLLVTLLSSSENVSEIMKSYITLWDLQIRHHMQCQFSFL